MSDKINIQITKSLHNHLKHKAVDFSMSIGAVVQKLFDDYKSLKIENESLKLKKVA